MCYLIEPNHNHPRLWVFDKTVINKPLENLWQLDSSESWSRSQRFGRYVLRPSSGVCRTLDSVVSIDSKSTRWRILVMCNLFVSRKVIKNFNCLQLIINILFITCFLHLFDWRKVSLGLQDFSGRYQQSCSLYGLDSSAIFQLF